MKLSKMTKEELELMPYTEIAALYLKENKKTMNTADLFKEVCHLVGLSESEYFFGSLTTSKEFVLLDDGTWDLKENHSIKVNIEDIYEEKDEFEEPEEELEEEIEPDDLDNIDDENYIDDDEDLSDLTIIDDEELEE